MATNWDTCRTRRSISWPSPLPWRARFTPSPLPRSRPSPSIATTRCGPASAARTVREGVALDPPRRKLQEFMAARRREGMLLTLCSKNNEDDVTATFRRPSGNAAAASRISRRSASIGTPRPRNLASLASELEIGLDTFILVDDSPKECRKCRPALPQALALAAARAPRRNPRFSVPRLGLRPRPHHRGGPPPRRNVRRSAPSAHAPSAPPPAWKISSRHSSSKSGSHRWSRRRWPVSRSSRSAPTR